MSMTSTGHKMIALLKSPIVILITLAFGLIKSIEYGILLWVINKSYMQLPIYFDLIGMVGYSAYIPITFDTASIFSSICLGVVFPKINNKGLLLGPLIFVLMVLFIILR